MGSKAPKQQIFAICIVQQLNLLQAKLKISMYHGSSVGKVEPYFVANPKDEAQIRGGGGGGGGGGGRG